MRAETFGDQGRVKRPQADAADSFRKKQPGNSQFSETVPDRAIVTAGGKRTNVIEGREFSKVAVHRFLQRNLVA
jgi:hypothetical protein